MRAPQWTEHAAPPRERQQGRYGLWHALAAGPAMVGSLGLLVVAFGWMGPWEGLVLLGWAASGAMVLTQVGERIAVRGGCGFHRPTRHQTALLAPVWGAALRRCEVPQHAVDLYVQASPEPNAFAVGGRSVAVTSAVLAEFQAQRLTGDHLQAVLCHELGHLTRATRLSLMTIWLAAPWRWASRVVVRFALAIAGRQPRIPLMLVAVLVVGVAIVQSIQNGAWAAAVVLTVLAVAGVACPLADAAICRHSEHAADRYTAAAGLGPQLAEALRIITIGRGPQLGRIGRVLSRHPAVEDRIDRLAG